LIATIDSGLAVLYLLLLLVLIYGLTGLVHIWG